MIVSTQYYLEFYDNGQLRRHPQPSSDFEELKNYIVKNNLLNARIVMSIQRTEIIESIAYPEHLI